MSQSKKFERASIKTTSITTTSKYENWKITYVPPLYKCNSHQYPYSLNICNSSFSVSFQGMPRGFDN